MAMAGGISFCGEMRKIFTGDSPLSRPMKNIHSTKPHIIFVLKFEKKSIMCLTLLDEWERV